MFLILFTLVVSSLVLWLYIRWNKAKRFWADRGVPHDPPHPIMGSLTFLQRVNPAIWMRQLYAKFDSPYVGMWLFWRPALVINSPEIAKRILVKDSDIFRNRFLSSGKTDPIGSLNLFTVNDPIWTSIRRRLTPVFTAAKLKNHNSITQVKAKDLVTRIKNYSEKNENFQLRTTFSDFTTDVIGESAFGIVSESAKTGDSAIRKITRDFMGFSIQRGLSWSSIFFFPEMVDIFRFSLFPKDTMEELRHIYRSIIQQRGGLDREIKDPKDLLDSLLKIRQEAKAENEEMSEDFLLSQAAVFLVGGFDTSGATMSWICYELAWHPHYQEALYQEIKAAKDKLGGQEFDATILAELTYLTAVIKEALRLFPTMGWLDRVASKDYKIDEKLTIPAGTTIYVNAAGMHVDPKYFPDPLAFNPERFLPENEKNIVPYSYLPFGEGPRNCIGKRFAYQQIRQGICSIILNFRLETLPNTPKPNEVNVENKGMFLMPLDEKMLIKFIPREKA